jgi:DNA-directed RNA polymerase subunit beta
VRDAIDAQHPGEDDCPSHEQALLKILRPSASGQPAQPGEGQALFAEKFFDANRYRLGKVGRFR